MATNTMWFNNFYGKEKRLKELYSQARKMQENYFINLQSLGLIEKTASYSNKLLKDGISKLFNTKQNLGIRGVEDIKNADDSLNEQAMSVIQQDINDLVQTSVTDYIAVNGLYALKHKIENDVKANEDENILFGDILEFIRTSQLTQGIEDLFKDRGFKVINTSPKEFGESVKYDIRIEIPDMETSLDKNKGDKILGSMRFEVKSGTNGTKGFKLGRVSGNTILDAINDKQGLEYYKTLSNYIDQVIQEFTVDYGIDNTDGYIDYPIVFANYTSEELFYEIGINYVTWRLENNFPIFLRGISATINNPGSQILLCTEFLWNLGNNIGMEVDVDTMEDYITLDIEGNNPEQIKKDAMERYKKLMYKNINMMTVFYGQS